MGLGFSPPIYIFEQTQGLPLHVVCPGAGANAISAKTDLLDSLTTNVLLPNRAEVPSFRADASLLP